MTKSSKKTDVKSEDSKIQDKAKAIVQGISAAEAKEIRRKNWEAKQNKSGKDNPREQFRVYFISIKEKLQLESSMELVIWLHLKAIKHDKKEKFQDGIKNFGYKV